jgi:CubicO group peptidase (beta-lactamase class C family)
MTATSSRFADFEKRPNRAFGHVKIGDGFQPKYQRLPDPESPAGGVSSSANDLARWMALVLQNGKFEGRQIIPADALLPAVTAEVIRPTHPRSTQGQASTGTDSALESHRLAGR